MSSSDGREVKRRAASSTFGKRLVKGSHRAGLYVAGPSARDGPPRLVELDGHTASAHPDGEADAAVPAHCQTNLFLCAGPGVPTRRARGIDIRVGRLLGLFALSRGIAGNHVRSEAFTPDASSQGLPRDSTGLAALVLVHKPRPLRRRATVLAQSILDNGCETVSVCADSGVMSA
jgi:hypothetical protein